MAPLRQDLEEMAALQDDDRSWTDVIDLWNRVECEFDANTWSVAELECLEIFMSISTKLRMMKEPGISEGDSIMDKPIRDLMLKVLPRIRSRKRVHEVICLTKILKACGASIPAYFHPEISQILAIFVEMYDSFKNSQRTQMVKTLPLLNVQTENKQMEDELLTMLCRDVQQFTHSTHDNLDFVQSVFEFISLSCTATLKSYHQLNFVSFVMRCFIQALRSRKTDTVESCSKMVLKWMDTHNLQSQTGKTEDNSILNQPLFVDLLHALFLSRGNYMLTTMLFDSILETLKREKDEDLSFFSDLGLTTSMILSQEVLAPRHENGSNQLAFTLASLQSQSPRGRSTSSDAH